MNTTTSRGVASSFLTKSTIFYNYSMIANLAVPMLLVEKQSKKFVRRLGSPKTYLIGLHICVHRYRYILNYVEFGDISPCITDVPIWYRIISMPSLEHIIPIF